MSNDYISVLLLKNVLLVTFPSDPDDDTIAFIQKKILERLQETGAKGLILDISTVEILDSYFARIVLETAQMIQVMGGRTIIAGMRPAVAITATELGLVLSDLESALDVDQAFDRLQNENDEWRDEQIAASISTKYTA